MEKHCYVSVWGQETHMYTLSTNLSFLVLSTYILLVVVTTVLLIMIPLKGPAPPKA